jgi:signal transduction histidine kinase
MVQGMKYSDQRASTYLFSDSYFSTSQGIFVRKDDALIHQLRDLEQKVIVVQKGDISSDVVNGIRSVSIVYAENQEEALKLLLSRKVDAFVGNRMTGQYFLQQMNQSDQVKIVGDPIEPTKYSAVVMPDHQQLLTLWNSGLRKIKENGTYSKIESKWFGEYAMPYSWKRLETILHILQYSFFAILVLAITFLWWNFSLKKEVKKRTTEYKTMLERMNREDRLRSLGQLVAGVAHEIRNPLMSIFTYTQLLPKKYDSPAFRQAFLEQVPAEMERLNQVVSDLVDFSQPRRARPVVIELYKLIESISFLFQQKEKEKRVRLTQDIPEDLHLYADPGQIKQILINLIMNAFDATPAGKVIHLEAFSDQEQLVVQLQDQGSGIPKEVADKIFEPFFTTKSDGVGLGLSICHQLVQENQGIIDFDTTPGEGTTFLIRLPRKDKMTLDEEHYGTG